MVPKLKIDSLLNYTPQYHGTLPYFQKFTPTEMLWMGLLCRLGNESLTRPHLNATLALANPIYCGLPFLFNRFDQLLA